MPNPKTGDVEKFSKLFLPTVIANILILYVSKVKTEDNEISLKLVIGR